MTKEYIPNSGYQQISTSDGVMVSGNDRNYLNDIVFEDDLSGKSILDIGSSQGHFCLEAIRRGAKTAIGIEPLHNNVKVARNIASDLNLNAEYVESDFESWETNKKYDTILCLNVLHHMYDPIHVLRKIVDLCNDKIVIEFSPPRWRDVINCRISLISLLAQKSPMMLMGKPKHPKDSVRIAEYTFMFTAEALKVFFNTHYSNFLPISIIKSPFKGRMIAIARKRKFDTITVVAGPTSVGKSTFIEKLESSEDFRKNFGIKQKIDMFASYKLYDSPISEPLGHIVMHYDILRPFGRAIRTHERDPVLSILKSAKKVRVLTLKATSERLVDQITTGELEDSPRHQKIKELYSDLDFLNRWYKYWNDFVKSLPGEVEVINVENNGEFKIND